MKSTRERILQSLLNFPRSTISQLAEAVNINEISVRHHLTSLEADGLATHEEERHGVGRPRLVYFLTEKGVEHFPTRYYRLTNRLLEQMKESLPAPLVQKILASMAADLASQYTQNLGALSTAERLNLVQKMLADEGFTIQWEEDHGEIRVHNSTCPYFHVGQQHPEICTVDQTLIASILEIPVEKLCCVLQGDHQCTYVIQKSETENKND